MTVMITGGAGFIGSHICVELIHAGRKVVVYDNFCNSHPEVINRIRRITGTAPDVVKGDVRDLNTLISTLSAHGCSAVIHLAGLKSVADSVSKSAEYYDCNVVGTLRLAQAMQQTGVRDIVFSSSATVYGEPDLLPLREDHKLAPFSPYGRTKMQAEELLGDIAHSLNPLNVAVLRYFNPVGSHESGLIGEDPNGVPSNLMPYISGVAVGRLRELNVYGNDYPTSDGTGIRDYVHVVDLAAGHIAALDCVDKQRVLKVNLGTGEGTSVLELVDAYARESGKMIPVIFAPRRPGDIASYYASVELAADILGWHAKRGIAEMCRDAWNWQRKNPNGYLDQ
ncbi:UDP-glucose 4-epimerase GalE [Tardiphaga sp. P9-11]|uniref:UDP-glucose 4-epimerase GalE n=1 Tax=Tardiphaga sp. P9-11 TaxID=2024614 RepID=UPI0011F33253|nr:UDP-glucose 4-epimerase GalE [Tardiphaga sp. P9-11]KAA0072998.1 UDP-glucose 4-epimerase GalE [Tardiphaga sp. P9-11]